ncbi:Adenylyl cyclase-associated protein [Neolecta irregularis DAH-3]|uniref:Adenylyl cyclase-associated protein n=1 Tax=Neolecta irregularis (strain DAH-3) TaxID=1198029 RepID=A0A1U7LG89_NEOID|nr:Adenylyl cyclase-associated protein [Neolecta irregularis DAH-3]|eukprot:OLL21670.1 Adenylyl cyclase-associated protein [Neolecta irregularis DAH-3]
MTDLAGLNLTTLIKRLEAATSRLEDLAEGPVLNPASSNPQLSDSVDPSTREDPTEHTSELSPVLADFDTLVTEDLSKYLLLSKEIGDVVNSQAQMVQMVFLEQRRFLELVVKAKKVDMADPFFTELIKPIQGAMVATIQYREKHRASTLYDHLSTVGEGIPALGWVAMEPTPALFVGEMKDAAEYWGNRVIKEYKNKNLKHVEWAQSFIHVLACLRCYVKVHHTAGLKWDPNGGDARTLRKNTPANTTIPSRTLPPPGPPPPPPFLVVDEAPAAPNVSGDMNAVFSQINQGTAVTAGLRKVDKSEMVHKNPELRTLPPIRRKSSPGPGVPKKPSSLKRKCQGLPIKELDGNKWIVENFDDNQKIILDQTERNHVVQIANCEKSTIKIVGKINAVSIACCSKLGIVVDSLVATLELIRCKDFSLQITGKVPTVLVDQCNAGQIYLSPETLDVEIITSSSTGINVQVPNQGEEGNEFAERAVPEQIKVIVVDGKLVSSVVEHVG